jgi:predicted small secreted protein
MGNIMFDKRRRYSLVTIMALVLSAFLITACEDDPVIVDKAQEAADELDDAVDSMDKDRSVGEKIGDAVEDAGEKIQDAAN